MQYEVKGAPFPVLVCNLAPGESIKCQKGSMAWMSPNMEMQTKGGGIGKMLGKAFTGESMFENIYTATGGPGMIAFAAGLPGNILPVPISPQSTIIAQKSAFLACETGVNQEVFFQKKLGAGLFGGEGFIMQKFTGNGLVFIEIDGSTIEYNLAPGQPMILDTGSLAAMEATVNMEIQQVKGLGNVLVGGEGLFNTKVVGPGRIWLQTMPLSGLASAIQPYIVTGR